MHIKPEIVCKKLKELNPNKSPGYDKCHPQLLKELADEICSPLATLYDKSLNECAHDIWRKAVITPIYKKDQRSDPGNYRPVSITSVISKIMESIIKDAIVENMTKSNLFADEQHGFVPGRDCVSQLLMC